LTVNIQEAVKVLGQKFLLTEGISGVSHQSRQLIVYVESPATAARVPSTLMGFPVKTVVTGPIRFLTAKTGTTLAGLAGEKTAKWRPCPGGVSVGHYMITAGTLATVVVDNATGARLFLSNNHVLAATNRGKPGDPILQPGPYDGGKDPRDRLGVLERFVELRGPPETNLVDAAVARPLADADLSDEVLDIGVITSVEEAVVGMTVAKSGRTTCYKEAVVEDVNATVKVWYNGLNFLFEDQIVTDLLGKPGDSGSICVNVASGAAVGLLFAGSSTHTILNKITNVERLLDVTVGAPFIVRRAVFPLWALPLTLGMLWVGSSIERKT